MAAFHQLQCMRSFVAVAEARSFTRAAHALQTGAASVSDHVGNFERHLDVSLLHRTTRSVRLTDEGLQYLATCREVLDRIDESEQRISRHAAAGKLTGLLRVEMSHGVDDYLHGAVRAFQEDHPGVSIQLLRSDRQFDTTAPRAEVVVRSVLPQGIGPGRPAGLVLGQSRTVFLASPDYLARRGGPAHPDELSEHDCIGYVDPLSGRLWEWYFGEGGGGFSRRVHCRLAMEQGELRRRAAVEGRGIINDIAWFTRTLVAAGMLVPVLEQWTMPQAICQLYARRDAYRSARVAAFVEAVRQWCEREAKG